MASQCKRFVSPVCFVALALAVQAQETQPEDCDAVAIANVTSLTDGGACWDPAGDPVAGKLYYVPSGREIRLSSTADSSFPGNLALAGTYVNTRNAGFTWTELRLLSGSKYSWSSIGPIYGKLVVEAENSSKPATINIFHPYGYQFLTIAADVSGAAGTYLSLAHTGKPYSPYGPMGNPDCPYKLTGEWSGFFGRCTVPDQSCFYPGKSAFVFPGELVVEDNAYYWGLSVRDATTTIGTLDLRDGASYWPACNAATNVSLTVVTNQLKIGAAAVEFVEALTSDLTSEGLRVKTPCTFPSYEYGKPVIIPIFKLTGAAATAAKLPDLSKAVLQDYPASQRLAGVFPRQKALVIAENDDGSKTVAAKYWDDVSGSEFTQVQPSGSYKWEECPYNPNSTKGVAYYWEPDVMPTERDQGVVYLKKATMFHKSGGTDYTNLTFVADAGCAAYVHGGLTKMERLILKGNYSLNCYANIAVGGINAPIYLACGASTLWLQSFQNYNLTLPGPIIGSSDVSITSPAGHSSPMGEASLLGDNSDFSGNLSTSITVQPTNVYDATSGKLTKRKYPDLANEYFHRITITNANALGGAYTGTTAWRSLWLNAYADLKVDGTTAFSEPTRGMAVNWGAQVEVADGKRFAIDVPITYGGELIKRGAGTLALGAEKHLIEEYGGSRGAGTNNVITVKAGALEIAHESAVDGIPIRFAEGTKLLLDPTPLGEKGFVATGLDTPLSSSAADGRIPVALDVASLEVDSLTVPLCTVKAAFAAVHPFKLVRPRHGKAEFVSTSNSDGSVTLSIRYGRTGFAIFLR